MSEGSDRAEMERRLIERSVKDDAFRQRLIEDPKAAVQQELGSRLPEEVRVVTVEESADTIYLVLPRTSTEVAEGGELSDQELQSVAGGWEYYTMGLLSVPLMSNASPSRFHLIRVLPPPEAAVGIGRSRDRATLGGNPG